MQSNTNKNSNVISFSSALDRQKGRFEAAGAEVLTRQEWKSTGRAALISRSLRRILETPDNCFHVTVDHLAEKFNLSPAALKKIPMAKLARFVDRETRTAYYLISDLAAYVAKNPSCRTLKVGLFH